MMCLVTPTQWCSSLSVEQVPETQSDVSWDAIYAKTKQSEHARTQAPSPFASQRALDQMTGNLSKWHVWCCAYHGPAVQHACSLAQNASILDTCCGCSVHSTCDMIMHVYDDVCHASFVSSRNSVCACVAAHLVTLHELNLR